MILNQVLTNLANERQRLVDELKRLDKAIDVLTEGHGAKVYINARAASGGKQGRATSSARSDAMREAAKKRWQPGGDLFEKRKAKQEQKAKDVEAQLEASHAAKPAKRGGKKK